MTARRRLPPVLATQPLGDALDRIEKKIDEHVVWDGENSAAVRTARWVVAEIDEAIRKAGTLWRPTSETARITGWDTATLTKWARHKLKGNRLPFAWRSLEVRRDGDGYTFRVSSIPARAKKAS